MANESRRHFPTELSHGVTADGALEQTVRRQVREKADLGRSLDVEQRSKLPKWLRSDEGCNDDGVVAD